jgi:hypothetical protein
MSNVVLKPSALTLFVALLIRDSSLCFSAL